MRMKKKNDKGITLIALIITIIVMLLLVGVTLNVALQGGLFGNAKEASLGQAHSMVMELLKTEEFTYLTEKESGKTTLALIDYLKEKGIITEETEDKYKINVEVLLGTAGRTGNGTDGKDVYKLEKSDRDEELGKKETKIKAMTIAKNPETKSNDNTGTKYVVNYYDNNGTAEKVGELFDLYGVELIKFVVGDTMVTAEKGMTWYEWVNSSFCPEFCSVTRGKFYCNGPDDEVRVDGGLTDEHMWIYGSSGTTLGKDVIKSYESGGVYNVGGLAECVSPTSKITTSADGKYTLAKDMSIGDKIAYYDFETSSTKVGTVGKVYIHKKATNFVRYEFNDGTYLEATDYHPIYTKEGWKSLTRRNNYPVPCEGDSVKTLTGWKEITKIETYTGVEDFYDFSIVSGDGTTVQNYFANGALVQSSL